MITLLTNLKTANQENADSLRIILKELVKTTPKEKGCVAYSIHQEADDSLSFYMLETWNTQEDIERHVKVLQGSGLLKKASMLLDGELNNLRVEKI